MPNNQFRRGELYFVITGVPTTALNRRLQRYFREHSLDLTVEQWSILVHLWKEDGISQQEICNRTYRDRPSVTRLIDNLEKLGYVERRASPTDRRINLVYLKEQGKAIKDITTSLANQTLVDGLTDVPAENIEITKKVLSQVYENLAT